MEHSDYVRCLERDAARLREMAATGLDAAVPSCPGWQVADLVEHVAEVYAHKVRCIVDGAMPDPWPPPPDGRPLLERFDEAYAQLHHELTTRDPWTFAETWWWDERTVGFWARRMAQESAIHRVDAELAHDAVTPVDPELALDGVDEVLRRFVAGDWSDEPQQEAPAVVHVKSGDTTWRVVLEPRAVVASVVVPRWRLPDPDATLHGDAEPLLLWLWGRGPDDALTVDGDAEAIAHLRRRLAFATQ